jgi:hypothetical protein
MTSRPIELLHRIIVKGPSKMDLLEAAFFDISKSLQFWFDDRDSILGRLVTYTPNAYTHQTALLIIEYHSERGCTDRLYIMYDHLHRNGRTMTLERMLEEIASLKR